MSSPPRVLSVAGSDSGGCAGIQADLRTFCALGVHGMTAVTAITAQDTCRVYEVTPVPPQMVARQIDVVVRDVGIDALKTGMLSNRETIEVVASRIRAHEIEKVVVDPVMASTGGDSLLESGAIETLKGKLFPLALIVTPNRRETELLCGFPVESEESIRRAAAAILETGTRWVIIKGGHIANPHQSIDYLFGSGREYLSFPGPRLPTLNTHGSGCTFASAIASLLARGLEVPQAVSGAKAFVQEAIRNSYSLGAGHGPLGHVGALRTASGSGADGTDDDSHSSEEQTLSRRDLP